MQLHNLKPIAKKQKPRRVGRGGKRGTFSGRGTKGQRARAGRRIRPALRDIIKKIPKKRGYRAKRSPRQVEVLNIKALEKYFSPGETVTPEILAKRNLIRRISGKARLVKILGPGSMSKKVNLKGVFVSSSARKAIEAAGGRIDAARQ